MGYMESTTYIYERERLVGRIYSSDADICAGILGQRNSYILYGRDCR